MAAGLRPTLDVVIGTPPASLGVAENVAADMLAGAVGGFRGAERLEFAVAGDGEHLAAGLGHGGGLLLGGGLDLRGGSGTLQNRPHLLLLRGEPLAESDLVLELVGAGFKAAERRFLLLAHRGGIALGGSLGHRLHLGDDGGEFVQQLLDLVHVRGSCCSDSDATGRLLPNYGCPTAPIQILRGGIY